MLSIAVTPLYLSFKGAAGREQNWRPRERQAYIYTPVKRTSKPAIIPMECRKTRDPRRVYSANGPFTAGYCGHRRGQPRKERGELQLLAGLADVLLCA